MVASIDEALAIAIQRHQAGDLRAADQIYRQILQHDPQNADALHLLGMIAHQVGEHAAAIQLIRSAIAADPQAVPFHNNLGGVYQAVGKLSEAAQCFRRAVALLPNYADAHYNLGNALRDQGNLDEAEASYQQALRIKPDYPEVYNNLGNLLQEQGKRAEAVVAYQRALKTDPQNAEANCNLVHQLQHLCSWDEIESRSERVVQVVTKDAETGTTHSIPPLFFIVLPNPTTAQQQLQCARNWVRHRLGTKMAMAPKMAFDHSRSTHDRIRLGYLSADFKAHPVGWAIRELLEKHDRDQFDVTGYSFGPDDGSSARQRIVQACDHFVEIRAESFVESAQRIHADRIDILIDLMGHTRDARTEILALRPAPIQVQYLGYPGTMGAAFIDYLIADEFVVRPDHERFYDEKLVVLPCCFFPNDSQRAISAEPLTRSACGLPDEGFVFCCFNNSYKISPRMFDVWMRLLQTIPNSVLWLTEQNQQASQNLRTYAAHHGVSVERLVFARNLPRIEDHLARYRLADLFLDTFPYNAHATASDALWGGCPVLTLAGDTFASRVAGSMLRAVGVPELVADSLDKYQETAVNLARNPRQLVELRARLAQNRLTSSLFKAGPLARHLERAYSTMWQHYLAGKPPQAIQLPG